jgi:hypothetical protein
MTRTFQYLAGWLAIWALGSPGIAQVDLSARERLLDWCAGFQSFGGVKVEWKYVPAGESPAEPFRERLVTDWSTGLLIEAGYAVGVRPSDGPSGLSGQTLAQARVVRASGDSVQLRWLSESPGHRSYKRSETSLESEHLSYLGHSEFVAARVCVAEFDENPALTPVVTSTQGRDLLSLAVSVFELEWSDGPEGLALIRITCLRPDGSIAFEQSLTDHTVDRESGLLLAHTRETSVPAAGDGGLSHVNTAYLESVAFLDEVPSRTFSLDVSGATMVDHKTGMLLDDQGRVIGPARGARSPSRTRWQPVLWFAGAGLVVGGAALWWIRRRGAS